MSTPEKLEALEDAMRRLQRALIAAGGSAPLALVVDEKTAVALERFPLMRPAHGNMPPDDLPTYVCGIYGIRVRTVEPRLGRTCSPTP